jgi:hypothetical protein
MTLKSISVLTFITLIAISLFSVSFAQEHHDKKIKIGSGELNLSDDLKAILSEEMTAIEKGMTGLVHEIAHGNWGAIEKTATMMEQSYIMKQKLSKHQLEELHHKLPHGFVELDQEFHKTAGMLAHVAKERHSDLVAFYFYKLTESCMKCHAKYAKNKFPGFSGSEKQGHH